MLTCGCSTDGRPLAVHAAVMSFFWNNDDNLCYLLFWPPFYIRFAVWIWGKYCEQIDESIIHFLPYRILLPLYKRFISLHCGSLSDHLNRFRNRVGKQRCRLFISHALASIRDRRAEYQHTLFNHQQIRHVLCLVLIAKLFKINVYLHTSSVGISESDTCSGVLERIVAFLKLNIELGLLLESWYTYLKRLTTSSREGFPCWTSPGRRRASARARRVPDL